MKRGMLWCLMVSLVIVSVLVAGCSKGGSTASNPTTSNPTAGSPTAPTQSQPGGGQSLADLINRAKQVQSVSFDCIYSGLDGKTTNFKIWFQGNQMSKYEVDENGIQSVTIYKYIDDNDGITINYDTGAPSVVGANGNGGIETKLSGAMWAQQRPKMPGDYLNGIDPGKVQDLGTAAINGYPCRIIQYLSADGQTTWKAWLSEDLAYPVQLISTDTDGKTTKQENSNIKVGSIPADTFSVPAGVVITNSP